MNNTDRYENRRLAAKRAVSLALCLLFLFAAFGCEFQINGGKEAAVSDIPIEIIDDTPVPATATPTAEPTEVPTEAPTPEPTEEPTQAPTAKPTAEPTKKPSPATGSKIIYLSFDDGPYKYTDEVLDILKEYHIKATFFTIGNCIKVYPEQAKRIVAEGHVLGCHTQTHDFSKLYNGTEGFLNDVKAWRKTVVDTFGYDAGSYVLRFPGGTTNYAIGGRKNRGPYVKAVNKAGYKIFDWNLGNNDRWAGGNKDNLPKEEYFWKSYLDYMSMYKNEEPKICLIHDTEKVSVKMLRRILDDMIARGYEFGLLTDLEDNYLM